VRSLTIQPSWHALAPNSVRRGSPGWSWTDEDRRLGDMLANYWTNFARTGDPNGPGLPRWPEYRTADRKVMHFAAVPTVAELPNQGAMKLMDDFVATLRPAASDH
jgi:para-nitrobenzyl esterase